MTATRTSIRPRRRPLLSGAEVRRLRVAALLSQAELARRIGYCRSAVCMWESGARLVPEASAFRVVAVLLDALQRQQEWERFERQLRKRSA